MVSTDSRDSKFVRELAALDSSDVQPEAYAGVSGLTKDSIVNAHLEYGAHHVHASLHARAVALPSPPAAEFQHHRAVTGMPTSDDLGHELSTLDYESGALAGTTRSVSRVQLSCTLAL